MIPWSNINPDIVNDSLEMYSLPGVTLGTFITPGAWQFQPKMTHAPCTDLIILWIRYAGISLFVNSGIKNNRFMIIFIITCTGHSHAPHWPSPTDEDFLRRRPCHSKSSSISTSWSCADNDCYPVALTHILPPTYCHCMYHCYLMMHEIGKV